MKVPSLGLLLLLWGALGSTANASPITYAVDRSIAAGTVVGFIQTDGTSGILSISNIIDWQFTLSSPNLWGPSPVDIDFASQVASSVAGTGLSATATELVFDFSNTGSRFWFQGESPNIPWWGMSTVEICPSGGTPCIGEIIGWAPGNQDPAEVVPYSGRVMVASAVTNVPIPATLYLVAVAVVGLTAMRRAANGLQG